MELDVIVAADEGGGIGRDGGLPWRLRGDMAYFRSTTTETRDPARTNAVIMGRKTWESIPETFRPLAGRLNVVLTRDPAYPLPAGVLRARSLDGALARLDPGAIERVFVIGGGTVYAEAFARPDLGRVYLTRVSGARECDTFLPPLPKDLRLESASGFRAEGDLRYRFEVYVRS